MLGPCVFLVHPVPKMPGEPAIAVIRIVTFCRYIPVPYKWVLTCPGKRKGSRMLWQAERLAPPGRKGQTCRGLSEWVLMEQPDTAEHCLGWESTDEGDHCAPLVSRFRMRVHIRGLQAPKCWLIGLRSSLNISRFFAKL